MEAPNCLSTIMHDPPLWLDFELRPARPEELSALVRLDDDACVLYEEAGMTFSFPSDHPFIVDEWRRWREAIQAGHSRVLATRTGELVAFAIFGRIDGQAYLDQLSVHPAFMRRGLGRALLAESVRWAGERDLWLTTYAHLAWNGPYYRRFGFVTVEEERLTPGLREMLVNQRAALPDPEQRIAMVRPAASIGSA